MLATGSSMELSYQAMLTKGHPSEIHIASIIASQQAIEHIKSVFPKDKTTVWCAAIDPEINEHSYIMPVIWLTGKKNNLSPKLIAPEIFILA